MADGRITSVLDFWFDEKEDRKRWFQPPPGFDDVLREKFGGLVEAARKDELDGWAEGNPHGALALILLLDQFPRNLFRGSALSYSSDAKARTVAVKAIAQGHDRQLKAVQEIFMYLPLMHDESLQGQALSYQLYEGFVHRHGEDADVQSMAGMSMSFAKRHLDTILKFGRFPARNAALARQSTDAEVSFLKENPMGF